MGEAVKDRLRMLEALAGFDPPPESVPINCLVAIEGTPLENASPVDIFELVRLIATARIAGIQGAKRTHELIPMCHNLPLDAIEVNFTVDEKNNVIHIEAIAKCVWKTGVEMEAMTAVAIAGLTIYDMVKAVDKHVVISEIKLEQKSGGKSGEFIRQRKVL